MLIGRVKTWRSLESCIHFSYIPFFDPNNTLDFLDPNHIFEFQRCCKNDVRERSTCPCFKVILAYSANFLGTSFFLGGEVDLEDWWGDGVELLVIFLIADQEIALFTLSPNFRQFQFEANV